MGIWYLADTAVNSHGQLIGVTSPIANSVGQEITPYGFVSSKNGGATFDYYPLPMRVFYRYAGGNPIQLFCAHGSNTPIIFDPNANVDGVYFQSLRWQATGSGENSGDWSNPPTSLFNANITILAQHAVDRSRFSFAHGYTLLLAGDGSFYSYFYTSFDYGQTFNAVKAVPTRTGYTNQTIDLAIQFHAWIGEKLVGVAYPGNVASGNLTCTVSFDAGRTWTGGYMRKADGSVLGIGYEIVPGQAVVNGDTLYIGCTSFPPGMNGAPAWEIVRSRDGGVSWVKLPPTPGYGDKRFPITDQRYWYQSPCLNVLPRSGYLTWGLTHFSADDGQTWQRWDGS